MGSRLGSLIVLVALGVIVAVAAILVSRFAGDSDGEAPAIVVSLVDDQPVLLGQPLEIEVRARSGEPITIITLLVDGVIVTQATPVFDADQGRYDAVLFWTPDALGFASLLVVATNTAGAETEVGIRVDVTDDTERVAQAQQQARAREPAGSQPAPPSSSQEDGEQGDSEEPASGTGGRPQGDAAARILSPEDGTHYVLGSGERLDVEIETSGTGPLSSVLFYVTPILADGSFGRSRLAHSATPDVTGTGSYREVVLGVEVWLPEPGSYDLQLVALTVDEERFEDKIRITVSGSAATDPPDEADQEEDRLQEQDEAEGEGEGAADLAILTVRQDQTGISVTIINTGDARAERAEIDLTLIRVRDGSALAATAALVTLAPEQRANVPLDVIVDEPTDALITLEADASADSDTTNNTFRLELSPASEIERDEDTLEGDEPSDEGDEGDDEGVEEQQPAEATDLPDLAFQEARFTDDGYALLTVVNAGEAAAGDFVIHVLAETGEVLESISRGASAGPLEPRSSEILAGGVAHTGTVVIILDPDDRTAESNEANNLIRVEVGP